MNKIPPNNPDHEKSLLAHMLFTPSYRQEVFELIKPEEFYATKHQKIFQAMLDLKDQEIDLVTVTERLRATKNLESLGGAYYVASLLDYPISTDVKGSALIIHQYAVRRELIVAAHGIINKAYDCDNAQKLIDDAQAEINSISIGGISDNFHHISELLPESLDRYQKAIKDRKKTIFTGMEKFDKFIRLAGPKNVILAGRPSMGKTSLMKNLSTRIAERGFPVAIFSLEMSREAIIDSTISEATGIPSIKLYNKLDRVDYDNITTKMANLHELPLYIDDDFKAKDIYELKRRCRIAVKKLGVKIIFIDQISKVNGITGLKKTEEVSRYSNIISDIVKELSIPIVTLSQLNREVEKRPKSKPILSDLKQTGSLEEDADVVLLLYRKGYYSKDPEDTTAEIIIAKQRIGPTGYIEMNWDAKRMEFNEAYDGGYK